MPFFSRSAILSDVFRVVTQMLHRATATILRAVLSGLCLGVMLCGQCWAQTNLPGSVDVSFNVGNGLHGANGAVRAVALQPDGKVIIGGQFTEVGGVVRRGFARVNPNGTVDTAFGPGVGISDFIYTGGFYESGEPLLPTAMVGAIAL